MRNLIRVVTVISLAAVASSIVAPMAAASQDAVGNRRSFAPDVSSNGRYVVFASDATNLASGDTNGKRDIFIRDTVARTTKRVTKGVSGQTNGHSFSPKVSDDGRYVAFLSDATNLVPRDTNRVTDAFRADLRTGTVVRVSVGSQGAQANAVTSRVVMSANGASIAFASEATNLAAGDTNGRSDIFLRDLAAASPRRLSPNGATDPSISPDGKWVGFLGWDGHAFGWNRATNARSVVCRDEPYDGYGEEYCTLVAASNAGVSTQSWGFYGCCTYYYGIEVTAKPTNLSFDHGWSPFYDYVPTGILDVTTFGATALVRDGEQEGGSTSRVELVLMDKTGILANLGTDSNSAALAGNGASVVMEQNQQIVQWKRATGSSAVVSVR